MRTFANIVLWAYIPLVLALFAFMRDRRRAVLASFVIALEFLPMAEIKLPLLMLTKGTACSVGVLLGACLFDMKRLLSFRPRLYDVPMVIWCCVPLITSTQMEIGNDGGWYDGASAMATQVMNWGVPYFIGRVYLSDLEGLRELCLAIFLGALLYIPLCLWEVKMSPLLHKIVYGWFQHDLGLTKRGIGYRPMVFMQSGLALGMWMCMAAMIGIWMAISRSVKQIMGMPFALLAVVMTVGAVACQALTGVIFLILGLGALFWARMPGVPASIRAMPLLLLILFGPAYMFLRGTGVWDGNNLIEMASVTGERGQQSIKTRIEAENALSAKVMDRQDDDHADDIRLPHSPWFGFGKWSDRIPQGMSAPWRVYKPIPRFNPDTNQDYIEWRDDAATDGMWVITLGTFGLLGLISLTVCVLLPPLLAMKRIPLAQWSHPLAAPATGLAVLLVLHMLDNLLNAMENPVFILAIGGISALGTRGVKRNPVAGQAPFCALPPEQVARGFPMTPAPVIPGGFPNLPGLQAPAISSDEFTVSAWPAPIQSPPTGRPEPRYAK